MQTPSRLEGLVLQLVCGCLCGIMCFLRGGERGGEQGNGQSFMAYLVCTNKEVMLVCCCSDNDCIKMLNTEIVQRTTIHES